MISVTLQFNDFAAAAHALMRIATPEQFATAVSALPSGLTPAHQLAVDAGRATATATPAGTVIEYHDRPDVGAPVAPPLPPLSTTPTPLADINAAAAFGGAVAQAAPLLPPAAPPTPPAAPSAPTAVIAPTAVPGTVERDSAGLPWDARIHASTKTKVASGAWTAKRNVDPAFKAQVEADLRGLPAPAAAAPAAPVAPPAAPLAPAPVDMPQAPAARTFAQYMAEIGGMFSARPVDAHNAMTAALAPHGMQHVGQLAGKPELIDAVDAAFKAALG